MKLLPALLLLPVLSLGAMAPAMAQYGRSLYTVTVPGERVPDYNWWWPRASDCIYINSPTIGLSAADYTLVEFDPANPGPAPALAGPPRRRLGDVGWYRDCNLISRLEAMGRPRIAERDRTWNQATEAMARGDYPQALELLRKGYRRVGMPDYAYSAAMMLYNGQGVPRDAGQAIELFDDIALARETRRMRMGFNPSLPDSAPAAIHAMLALADINLAGKDVPRNPRFAAKLLERAVDAGYVPARLKLARLLTSGPGAQRDYRRAAELLKEAAQAAHATSQYALAQLYERGFGVELDAAKAFEWYRQAAFNLYDGSHHAKAQYRLARMLDSGTGAARDPAKALALYRLAAQSGYAEALAALADYLYRGEQVGQDLSKARDLYRAAAERGSPDAMSNLASLLARGDGGPADAAQAYSWLLVADKSGHPDAGSRARVLQASLTPEQRAKVESALLPVLSR